MSRQHQRLSAAIACAFTQTSLRVNLHPGAYGYHDTVGELGVKPVAAPRGVWTLSGAGESARSSSDVVVPWANR